MKLSNKKHTIQGRWYKIDKNIKKKITAKYHRIKDWEMDPKGYFLIHLDKKKKLIKVGYCVFNKKKNHELIAEIYGKNALEIINTLIREKFISSLQHAGDMGIELCKAEIAMKYQLNYIQDRDIEL